MEDYNRPMTPSVADASRDGSPTTGSTASNAINPSAGGSVSGATAGRGGPSSGGKAGGGGACNTGDERGDGGVGGDGEGHSNQYEKREDNGDVEDLKVAPNKAGEAQVWGMPVKRWGLFCLIDPRAGGITRWRCSGLAMMTDG